MKKKIDNGKDMLFEMMHKVGGMPLNENVEEGWGKNLVAGGLATAATLGGMSGAKAGETRPNEPVKQGTENVDKTQQETFYNIMIGIAKYRDNPRSSIEAKKVYDEIIKYFSALKEGNTPTELSEIAKKTVKNWYELIKTTDNSTINTFIKLGEKTTAYFNNNSTDNVSRDNAAQKVAKNMGLGENENPNTSTPNEQQIVADILSVSEGVDDWWNKFLDYGKKGLLTAAIILTIASSTQAQQQNKSDDVIKAGVEMSDNTAKIQIQNYLIGASKYMAEQAGIKGHKQLQQSAYTLMNKMINERDTGVKAENFTEEENNLFNYILDNYGNDVRMDNHYIKTGERQKLNQPSSKNNPAYRAAQNVGLNENNIKKENNMKKENNIKKENNMKKDSSKDMLFEMMHKVGNMPLNENYPMGAEPEYAGDDAPYNQNDDDEDKELYEPDPDEYRDDDLSEDNISFSISNKVKEFFKKNFKRIMLFAVKNSNYVDIIRKSGGYEFSLPQQLVGLEEFNDNDRQLIGFLFNKIINNIFKSWIDNEELSMQNSPNFEKNIWDVMVKTLRDELDDTNDINEENNVKIEDTFENQLREMKDWFGSWEDLKSFIDKIVENDMLSQEDNQDNAWEGGIASTH